MFEIFNAGNLAQSSCVYLQMLVSSNGCLLFFQNAGLENNFRYVPERVHTLLVAYKVFILVTSLGGKLASLHNGLLSYHKMYRKV